MLVEIKIISQNFCSTFRVPSVRIYMLYKFEIRNVKHKQCKIHQMAAYGDRNARKLPSTNVIIC